MKTRSQTTGSPDAAAAADVSQGVSALPLSPCASPSLIIQPTSTTRVQHWLSSTASRRRVDSGVHKAVQHSHQTQAALGPGPSRLRYSSVYDFDGTEIVQERAASPTERKSAERASLRKRGAPPGSSPMSAKRPCSSSSSASVPSLTSASTASLASSGEGWRVPTIRVVHPSVDEGVVQGVARLEVRESKREERGVLEKKAKQRITRKPVPASSKRHVLSQLWRTKVGRGVDQENKEIAVVAAVPNQSRWSNSTIQSEGGVTTIADELQDGFAATPISACRAVQRMEADVEAARACVGMGADDHGDGDDEDGQLEGQIKARHRIPTPSPEQQRAALTRIKLTPTRLFYCRSTGRVNLGEAAVMEPALLALKRRADRETSDMGVRQ